MTSASHVFLRNIAKIRFAGFGDILTYSPSTGEDRDGGAKS